MYEKRARNLRGGGGCQGAHRSYIWIIRDPMESRGPDRICPSSLYLWREDQGNREDNVLNGVVDRAVVNRWPGTVPRLSASNVVAEGTCGKIAMLKWRAPILDWLCQHRPIDQNGPGKYARMAEQCWLC